MAKEKTVKADEPTVESLQKQIDNLCAEVRRHSDNWKRFATKHIGSSGGKVGEVK